MLAMCVADGLTVGSRVYRKGEVFPATTEIAGMFSDFSDDQIARRQVKLYKRVFYRKVTLEEMVVAYDADKALAKHMTDRERKMIAAFKLRKKQDSEDFMSQLDVDPKEIEKMVNPPKPAPEPEVIDDITEEEAGISEEMDEARSLVEEQTEVETKPAPKTTTRRSTSGKKKSKP